MKIEISPQITLTPLELSDAATISILVNQNREELETYFPWAKHVQSREDAEDYIAARVRSGNFGARWFNVKFNGIKSGVFGIKHIDKDSQSAELGYWLTREVRGNGITNKIIHSLSHFLAKAQSVKTIEFRCLDKNEAGIGVITRAGGKFIKSVANDMDNADIFPKINVYHLDLAS